MNIHKKDKTIVSIPSSEIEKITFSGVPTLESDAQLRDMDGNVYQTVRIGTQIWMAENLRTTKYNDGTPIPEIKENKAWADTKTGAFSWYNNDSSAYDKLYGKLYNWYAIDSGKLALAGWRVPTDEDWDILIKHLGGEKEAGAKMKVIGAVHWQNPNTGANNESGFSALPGYRADSGGFWGIGQKSGYWTATMNYTTPRNAWLRDISHNSTIVNRNHTSKNSGYYIRFVKE